MVSSPSSGCVWLTKTSLSRGASICRRLARLSAEDQVFVMAFVQCHGSIKQMERIFGISYPTVKKRLDSIASRFEFVVSEPEPVDDAERSDVIDQLERGEITVDEAVERLSG